MAQLKKTNQKNNSNNSNISSDFKQIPNPYNPYDIESGKLFYRKDVIKKVKKLFRSESAQKLIIIQGYSGSGKTSTLRKMADDPTILGDMYIPIYLKPEPDIIPDLESFLLFIHQSIKVVLENYGVSVEGVNISNISLHGLQQVINRIGFKSGDKRIIVLIFDDFEKIQKSFCDEKKIRDIISLLRYLLTVENKFRLIIAGAGQMFEWATGTELKNFLNTDARIDLQRLDEKLFEGLIVDPVINYMCYTPAAIGEIKSITGMNLYCQQLLCFYIINLLNEIGKNQCTKNEVRLAIINTINDQREDFTYFWDNLPCESKVVFSALSDDKVIKKDRIYYFIKESTILNTIFEKATLESTIKKLEADQYIKKMVGRRFKGVPYKVPLFGEWVKKNHSFPQAVVENWDFVNDRISLSNMAKILKAVPSGLLPFPEHTIKNAMLLSKTWNSFRKSLNMRRLDMNNLENLLEIFCKMLDFKIKCKPGSNKSFYLLEACSLNLNSFDEVRAFFFSDEELGFKEVNDIQEDIQQHFSQSSFFSFLFCVRKTDIIDELIRKEYLGIILVTEDDMKSLALSPRAVQVFKEEVVIPQVKPSKISKYQTHGPATITFYGRHDELGKILGADKKNFAIVGARKIGKTSLLHQIKKKLPKDTISIYMDLEHPGKQDYKSFMQNLQDKLGFKILKDFDTSDTLSVLKKLVIEFRRKTGKKIILLLDEIDILLKFDKKHEFQMIKTFRGLNQEGYCQFILSGFEYLSQAAEDIKSPLYNFCEFIRLGKLKKPDAKALISEPMKSIGVIFNDIDDQDLILQYTSCHPNLLQFFCINLLEKVEQHNDELNRRTIYKEDIQEFYNSLPYETYILKDFYLFETENVKPIERLVILLLLNEYPEKEIFSIFYIDEKLRNHGINLETGKLTGILHSLRLRYMLQDVEGRRYRFALPAFPVILKRIGDLESYIKKEIEHARKSK